MEPPTNPNQKKSESAPPELPNKPNKPNNKKNDPNNLSFIEHLEELRWRLLKMIGAVIVFAIVAFFLRDYLRYLLFEPLLVLTEEFPTFSIRPESPQAPFILAMKLSLIGGLIGAFPVVIYQLAAFVFPGLYPSEKRAFWIAFPFLILLFGAGVVFAYKIIIPIALHFFMNFGEHFLGDTDFQVHIEQGSLLNTYADFLLILVVLIGLSFQFPILVLVLFRAGIVDDRSLGRLRPYVLIAIMVVALIITPEVLSMIVFTIPMYGLFELSILICRILRKRNEKKAYSLE